MNLENKTKSLQNFNIQDSFLASNMGEGEGH